MPAVAEEREDRAVRQDLGAPVVGAADPRVGGVDQRRREDRPQPRVHPTRAVRLAEAAELVDVRREEATFVHLGFGRIVVSQREVLTRLANLV
jgi:hypothetical protein